MPTIFAQPTILDLAHYCEDLARKSRAAAHALATAREAQKNQWLLEVAAALVNRAEEIIRANAADLELATESGLSGASLDRLRLTPDRLESAAAGVRQVAALPDPIGQVRDSQVRPNGLRVQKVGVPLGVIFFIYESRPNVTVDAAALCIKSGNAIILRGGKEAFHSNRALTHLLQDCLSQFDLPREAIQLVEAVDREAVGQLLQLKDYIDLAIPRGGEGLIRRMAEEASMPVLKHYKGICQIYVDRAADLDMAESIIVNAKCQRPGVCNAAECLLIHADIAATFLPRVVAALRQKGVELRGCDRTRALIADVIPATDEDYATEYLDLILNLKVVEDIGVAIEHITRFGSRHSDAIVTRDPAAARRFTGEVDSAAVFVNASTRFHDGFEFGLGAEIGISTDKIHARGPCGLLELTSYKYIVYGEGQVRN